MEVLFTGDVTDNLFGSRVHVPVVLHGNPLVRITQVWLTNDTAAQVCGHI